MKKIISLLTASILLLTVCHISGCSSEAPLRFGLGVSAAASSTDASPAAPGRGQATLTAAAVLVDGDGRIVKAFLDTAENTVLFTEDGKADIRDSFETKHEAGSNYGMAAYSASGKEWYEQADIFCSLVIGKTADEVKALVAKDSRGTADVIRAGCTVAISDFAIAVEKAVANAAVSDAAADDSVRLGIFTSQTVSDAREDKPGYSKLEITVFAASLRPDGRICAAVSDCAEISFGFDMTGRSVFDTAAAIRTKREQGDGYGMKTYGGAAKEWYEQADAFDAAVLGMTAGEIPGRLGGNTDSSAALLAAGCTVSVSGLIRAAEKIG